MNDYKPAAEKTDEAERLLTPAFRRTDHDAGCEESLHAQLKSLRAAVNLERANNERLNTELHEMRKVNQTLITFLKDAAAYMNWAYMNDHDPNTILTTLAHDIGGLVRDEPCFLPRVTGYSK